MEKRARSLQFNHFPHLFHEDSSRGSASFVLQKKAYAVYLFYQWLQSAAFASWMVEMKGSEESIIIFVFLDLFCWYVSASSCKQLVWIS